MPQKCSSPASGGRRSVRKKSTPMKEVPANILIPVKQISTSEVKVSTASTTWSTLSRSTVGLPGSLSLTKNNFKDMVAAESYNHEEKCMKAFEGWLDNQSVVHTVKELFPKEPATKWCSMSYEDLVCYLLQYLEVQDAKTVYFDFAVNRHGMSDTAVFEQLKKLKTGVKECVSLLNHLLDNNEKLVHINIEEVAVVKANVSTQAQKMLVMETPKAKTLLAHCSRAIRACKKSPVAVTSPSVKTDIVIKTEKVDSNEDVKVIDVTNNGEDDVDPMNMNVYKNVVSITAKYASPKNAKKCIQVFVSNLFCHKTDEKKCVPQLGSS